MLPPHRLSLWQLWLEPAAGDDARGRRAGQACAALAALAGLLVLTRSLFGWHVTLDTLLFSDALDGNQMAETTALNFVLSGGALLLLDAQARGGRPAQWLALASGLIALAALIGYAYSINALIGVPKKIPMALHTATAFLLLAVGIFTARPEQGLMARIVSEGTGGALARRLLPVIVVAPLLLGWLILKGQAKHYYQPAFGFTIFVVLVIGVLSVLTWTNARSLDRQEPSAAGPTTLCGGRATSWKRGWRSAPRS